MKEMEITRRDFMRYAMATGAYAMMRPQFGFAESLADESANLALPSDVQRR